LGFFVEKKRTPLEPFAERSLDEMAPGTSCLAMAIIKPFFRQKLSGILSFFGLLQVADFI
jgi:hypothetical protein